MKQSSQRLFILPFFLWAVGAAAFAPKSADVSFFGRVHSQLRQSRERTTTYSSTRTKTKEFVGNIQHPLVVVCTGRFEWMTESRKNDDDDDDGITETDQMQRMKKNILANLLNAFWIVGPVWLVPSKAYAFDVVESSLISSLFTIFEKLGTPGLIVVTAAGLFSRLDSTNKQLVKVETQMNETKNDLKTQIEKVETNLDKKIDETKKDLKTQIDETKKDLKTQIEKVETQIDETKKDLKTQIEKVETNLDKKIDDTKNDLKSDFDKWFSLNRQDRADIVADIKECRKHIADLNVTTALMARNVSILQHDAANAEKRLERKIQDYLNDPKREKRDGGV